MDILKKKKACAMIIIALMLKKRIKRKRWMKRWLQRREHYTHLNLLKEIREEEKDDFANYYRMKDACYDQLLQMVKPYLTRQDTNMRKAITAEERLAVTLSYLATGRNIKDLKYSAIMSPAAISQSIIETCEALIYVLQSYIKVSKKHR